MYYHYVVSEFNAVSQSAGDKSDTFQAKSPTQDQSWHRWATKTTIDPELVVNGLISRGPTS